MSSTPPTPRQQRGRPSKKTPALLAKLSKLIAGGNSRRRAALLCKVCPKTIQLWLRDDPEFRDFISKAESRGSGKRAYVSWVNHPFRGQRPPRKPGSHSKPYPKPAFSIGSHWRRFPRTF